MKHFQLIVLLVMSLFVAPLVAQAAERCPPQPPWDQPSIPDGELATATEMQEAGQSVAAYVREIELWNSCNHYVHGLQSGRMVSRAREVAGEYNAELGKHLVRNRNTLAQELIIGGRVND